MSLYQIEEDLLRIFAEIEENDGEMSEELLAELNITKENLILKLGNYIKAVKSLSGDAIIAKEEAKKLTANAKVKENHVERLKKAMLGAVLLFGNDGKSGNKFIDLPTYKIFTKGSESVLTDETRIRPLIGAFANLIEELVTNDILYTGQDVDLVGILDSINANLKAEHEANNIDVFGLDTQTTFVPYTLTDLTTLQVQITTKQSIYDLFRNARHVLTAYGEDPIRIEMQDATSKDEWKASIKRSNSMNINFTEDPDFVSVSYPTVAKIVKNESIQIR